MKTKLLTLREKKSIKRQGELENSSHSVVDHAHISTHQTSRKQPLGG